MSGTSVVVSVGCDTAPPDSVGEGVAVGGHDGTVPHRGHGKGGVYLENTLAAPCMPERNLPSLRPENQELGSKLACSARWVTN